MKKILLTILACAAVFTACKKEDAPVLVSSITLDKTVTIEEGQTVQLTAKVLPENAADKTVTWTSDNSGVCSVDAKGVVTAVKVGTGNVLVTANDGSKVSATCAVTVVAKAVPITKIEISNTALNLKVGEEATLTFKVTPENTTTHDVAFISDNEEVAKVAQDGKVTALKAGTANIVAKSASDNVSSDACVVTVVEPKTMFLKFKKALMRVGGKSMPQQVWYGSADEYADREDVEGAVWTTGDAGVVSVEGSKYTAVAAGETTIKAADAEGNEIECAVKVLAPTDKNYDYNYGVPVIDCSVVTDAWKTKGTFVLGPGYVDGTQRITNENLTGYKLAEVNFYDKPCNASNIANPALYLRMYISDVSLITLDGAGEIELRSNMNSEYDETEEICWPWSYFCADAQSASANAKLHLKNGWNNIVLPFALSHQGQTTDNLGGFRPAKINYLRIFQNPGAAKTGVKFIIDQARIVNCEELCSCDNFDMFFDRMTDNNSFLSFKDTEDKKEGESAFGVADHIIAGATSNFRLEMWPGLEYAMPADLDASNSALKFWLYVSDGEAFKSGMHCVFELSSELINDQHNYSWAMVPGSIDFKTGWNEITLDFDTAGGDVRAESKRDVRKINYFRAVFTPQGAPAKPYTYKIDDIRIVRK